MVLADTQLARRCMFYRNGESHSRGKQVVVSERLYPKLDSLLASLTQLLGTPQAIERLYDIELKRFVRDLHDIYKNGHYLCAGRERLNHNVDYARVATPRWKRARRPDRRNRGRTSKPLDRNATDQEAMRRLRNTMRLRPLQQPTTANILQVHRHGAPQTERSRKYVVSARSAASLLQVCDALTRQLRVVGGVRCLLDLTTGKRIKDVEALFEIKQVVACGPERPDRKWLAARLALYSEPGLGHVANAVTHNGVAFLPPAPGRKNLSQVAVVPAVVRVKDGAEVQAGHNGQGQDASVAGESEDSGVDIINAASVSAPGTFGDVHKPRVSSEQPVPSATLASGVAAAPSAADEADAAESAGGELPSESVFVDDTSVAQGNSGATSEAAPLPSSASASTALQVDYLVAVSDALDAKTQAERQRQAAKAQAKMAARSKGTTPAAESDGIEQAVADASSLPDKHAAARAHQSAALQAKLHARHTDQPDKLGSEGGSIGAFERGSVHGVVPEDEPIEVLPAEDEEDRLPTPVPSARAARRQSGAAPSIESIKEADGEEDESDTEAQPAACPVPNATASAADATAAAKSGSGETGPTSIEEPVNLPARTDSDEPKAGAEADRKEPDGVHASKRPSAQRPVKGSGASPEQHGQRRTSTDKASSSANNAVASKGKSSPRTRATGSKTKAGARKEDANRAKAKPAPSSSKRGANEADSENDPKVEPSITAVSQDMRGEARLKSAAGTRAAAAEAAAVAAAEAAALTALIGANDNGVVPPEDVAALGGVAPSRLSFYGVVKESFVGHYIEFGKKLGDGNFADVLQCRVKATGEACAVKIIDKRNLPGQREELMILHEVRTLRQVSHPGCVHLLDVFETNGKIYLLLELMDGGDLFDHIVKHSKFSESDAKPMIKDMLRAVAYLHSRKIIHRDLKPENILLRHKARGLQLKLADFGLSMEVSERLYAVCGTPTYVAPEIISDSGTGYGLPVDCWAIGVISYILLCGFPPFSSSKKDQKELFAKIREGRVQFPRPYWARVSSDAKAFVSSLLTVDPAKRLTAKQALLHRWLLA